MQQPYGALDVCDAWLDIFYFGHYWRIIARNADRALYTTGGGLLGT